MTPPTPTALGGLRPVTLHITDYRQRDTEAEVIGSCAVRLVLTAPGQDTDPEAWAITHTLGSPAGGTHTEVAFDASAAELPERVVDDLVRQVGNLLYARSWAFHYRPDQVPDSVLRHGSLLRERVETSAVEVWS